MPHYELAAGIPAAGGRTTADATPAPSPRSAYPPALDLLLHASPEARDDAWARFLDEYSFLLLHAARSACAGREEAMDAYANVLDQLRDDDFRRLRGYTTDPRCRFTTWLVVVARRICVDLHRSRYGRERAASSRAPQARRKLRRQLEDMAAAEIDLAAIPDRASVGADARMVAAELSGALAAAVETLAPRDRLLLKLRFDDGLTAGEIATILRLPSQFHVYRRIRMLLSGLRGALRERGVEGPES